MLLSRNQTCCVVAESSSIDETFDTPKQSQGVLFLFQLSFRYVRDAPGRGAQLVRVYKRSKSLAQSVLQCGKNVAGFNFLSVLMIIMGWFIQFFQNFPVKVFAQVNKPVQRGGQCVGMTGEPKHSGVVCRGSHQWNEVCGLTNWLFFNCRRTCVCTETLAN